MPGVTAVTPAEGAAGARARAAVVCDRPRLELLTEAPCDAAGELITLMIRFRVMDE